MLSFHLQDTKHSSKEKHQFAVQIFLFRPKLETQLAVVRWTDIEAPKDYEGFGIGNMKMKNFGLLFKWWWRFSKEGKPLWKKIVKSKHLK